MSDRPASLPFPEITIQVDLSGVSMPLDLSALPARPGIFAFEDANGGTLALVATANLRRMVKSKLETPPESAGPTRRIDYRALARRILAVPVGSAFEADWTYLQLARQRLPGYRGLLDRWQAWFIHCDAGAEFPQFVKTAHPRAALNDSDFHLGPFPDKHAAGRYIEMLQDAFDLCRYHHLLVQAPNAVACVYKEMGRCPAPCDGSISMDEYRRRMDETIAFACTPIDQWRCAIETSMRAASDGLRFEEAQRLRQWLDRTAVASRAEFAHVDRLENFKFIAIMPGEAGRPRRRQNATTFLIRGGWIEPVGPLPIDADHAEIDKTLREIRARAKPQAEIDFGPAGIENIGMVCWHLFRPRRAKIVPGTFLPLIDALEAGAVAAALRKLDRRADHAAKADVEAITSRDADNLAADSDQA